MRNIQLADQLIKQTFGEDVTKGIERKQFNATDKHVTWSTEFVEDDATITCTVSKNGLKFKVSTDDVSDEFLTTQYNRVKQIRKELFVEEEQDENQLTLDDVNNDDTEQVTAEGTNTLEAKTSDDTVEELSNNDVFEEVEK
ncbi:hypothetical protein BFS35_011115 [Macrococcoides goetzii]|uniref:Uncharacterized protein n=1 Tax=Macrococcoides goetzii TaxID=1891097 RepID=A0A2G5NUP8_9STAP|nr:hypothetical protein [Macrococcus goetzii]RAI79688.1 hypothetical protein BFS35_011115 [Macrococcus goetzii]